MPKPSSESSEDGFRTGCRNVSQGKKISQNDATKYAAEMGTRQELKYPEPEVHNEVGREDQGRRMAEERTEEERTGNTRSALAREVLQRTVGR